MSHTLDELARQSTEKLRTFGTTHRGVGYRDENSQPIRFGKLVEVIYGEVGDGVAINDLGCGYGALFEFIEKNTPIRISEYFGYDLSPEMLVAGKEFLTDDRASFLKSPTVTTRADYSFVSGTFNHRPGATDEAWTSYVEETLLNLAEFSRVGFSFNMLTTYVDFKVDDLYYANPFHFFDYCKRNISKYVALSHDYPLFEWTMHVWQQPPSGARRYLK